MSSVIEASIARSSGRISSEASDSGGRDSLSLLLNVVDSRFELISVDP